MVVEKETLEEGDVEEDKVPRNVLGSKIPRTQMALKVYINSSLIHSKVPKSVF